jgi:hypothetical protein
MIARVWHGVAPDSETSEHLRYLRYIREELFQAYCEAPGNQWAILLARSRTGCTELLPLFLWESASFLESLTGPDIETALAKLINPSPMVKNYEVLLAHLPNHDETK